MAIINYITKNIYLPCNDWITGQSIYKQLHFMSKSQYWSREQIDNYQDAKLRQLIHHAYNHVPFYRDLFFKAGVKPDDIQTKKDLERLPITTKEELKRNKDKHLAVNIKKKELIFSSSSGSTGEPFHFYQTKHSESILKAAAIRAWSWMGYKLGDRYVKLSMNPRASWLKKMQDKLNNCSYLSSTQLSALELQYILNKIIDFDPLFIRCYPVPLYILARQISEKVGSYPSKSLRAINTTGSTLHENTRKEIEDIFAVKIFDSYSCEGGTVFSECPAHYNYHSAEEYAISEFIADKYTKADKEYPMRHISTDLHNYATPFIRYDTQDYIVLNKKERCACGRNLLSIKKIKGRDSDILKTPSGKYLFVENFVAYFEWIDEVDQIQVLQKSLDQIVIKIIVNSAFNNTILHKIQKYWGDYIGNDVHLTIELVDEIKLTPSGKRRTVIRDPKISLNE